MTDFQPAREQMAWVEELKATFAYSDLFAKYTEIVSLKIVSVVLEKRNNTLSITFHDGRILTIDDQGQSCCEERWITCDDDLSGLEGASLVGLNLSGAEANGPDGDDQQFVHVTTTKGSFTLCTHNSHNGYYGGFDIVAELHDMSAEEPEEDDPAEDHSTRYWRKMRALRPAMARRLRAARADVKVNPVTEAEIIATGGDPTKKYRKGSLDRWITYTRAEAAAKTWRVHPQTKAEQEADDLLRHFYNHQRRRPSLRRPRDKRPDVTPPRIETLAETADVSNVVVFQGRAA